MKQKVVLDTNVFISGYLWEGMARKLIKVIKSGNFLPLYCEQLLNELIKVLSLKFKLNSSEIYRIILDIKTFGKNVNVTSNMQPIKEDLTDNLFINLAIDGNAKIIVSGDQHLLKLKNYKSIEIMSISQFINQLNII